VSRFVPRLALSMMLVVVVSFIVIIGSQGLLLWFEYRKIPASLRNRLDAIEQKATAGQSPEVIELIETINQGFDRVQFTLVRATLIGLSAAGALSFSLAWSLARTIAKPVEKISVTATQVAKGDLSARVALSSKELVAHDQLSVLARNFNVMATSIEDSEHERRAMIADIAHELRTPLTALELRLEALLQDLVPFEKNEVERLKKQVTLLSRLVQDLRTLSLADEGQLSLYKKTVDVKQLVQDVLITYDLKAEQRDLQLKATLAEVRASLDPERFAQILGNLLENALRVTPENGTVNVTLTKLQATFMVCIADTGPGIPKADLPHIFERFVQARDTKGESTKGSSGLGLAIVQTLVQLHGGTVTAENRAEGGARFRLELPL
jgi:two-component system, OmpR family, sensor histidine kinase BaeS